MTADPSAPAEPQAPSPDSVGLPIAGSGRPLPPIDDVASTGWGALTIRVAWALIQRGVKLNPDVLRAARDHVILHLHPSTPLAQAEDRADTLVAEFVRRARRGADPRDRERDRWPQDAEMPLSPRWRAAIDRAADDSAAVNLLFYHYADRRPIDQLAMHLEVDPIVLESTRGGLHEVLRATAAADGMPLDGWPAERVDALLVRLATFLPEPCPPYDEVLAGDHTDHRLGCVRCDRLGRLLRAHALTSEDLAPPRLGARPQSEACLLLVQLHPDARRHRELLVEAMATRKIPIGEDLLAIEGTHLEPAAEAIALACLVGAPERHQIRGLVLTGPGRWTRYGLVGPLVSMAEAEVRCRSWGRVDGLPELPEPEPPPPSARRAWTAVAGLAACTTLIAAATLWPDPAPRAQLDVAFTEGRGGVWAAFDVEETAVVHVVRERDGRLEMAFSGDDPTDKLPLTTGDGSYRIHLAGQGVLLIATPGPIPHLEDLVRRSRSLEEVAVHLDEAVPDGAHRLYRR